MELAGSFRSHEVRDWFPYDPVEPEQPVIQVGTEPYYRGTLDAASCLIDDEKSDEFAAISRLVKSNKLIWKRYGCRPMTKEQVQAKLNELQKEADEKRKKLQRQLSEEAKVFRRRESEDFRRDWEEMEQREKANREQLAEQRRREWLMSDEVIRKRNMVIEAAFNRAKEQLGHPPAYYNSTLWALVSANVKQLMPELFR